MILNATDLASLDAMMEAVLIVESYKRAWLTSKAGTLEASEALRKLEAAETRLAYKARPCKAIVAKLAERVDP